jgi:hypothetical protein
MTFDSVPHRYRGPLPSKVEDKTGPAPADKDHDVPKELPDGQGPGSVGHHHPIVGPTTMGSAQAPSDPPAPEAVEAAAPSPKDTPLETGAAEPARPSPSEGPGARDAGAIPRGGPGTSESTAEAAQPAPKDGDYAEHTPYIRPGTTSSVPTGNTSPSEDQVGDAPAPYGLSAPQEDLYRYDDPFFAPGGVTGVTS